MKELSIQTVRTDLAEMGIDQDPEYIPFRFKESAFVGYFIGEEAITVYIGAESFLIKDCRKNIDLLESLM